MFSFLCLITWPRYEIPCVGIFREYLVRVIDSKGNRRIRGQRGVTEILRTSPITSSNSNNLRESEKSYRRFLKLEWRSSCQVGDRIEAIKRGSEEGGDLQFIETHTYAYEVF